MLKLLFGFLAVCPLLADAGDTSRWRTGSDLTLLQPTGALNDSFTSTQGLGASLYLDRDLGNGHGVRTRVFYGYFGGRSAPGMPSAMAGSTHLSTYGLNVSYTYHFAQPSRGPWLWLGAGTREFEGAGMATPPFAPANGSPLLNEVRVNYATGPRFALTAGAGFTFSPRWSASLGYHWNRAMGQNLGTVEAGIAYRP